MIEGYEYFDDGTRKWTNAEWFQMEANAPERARWSTLAAKLGITRSHEECLALLAMKKCPVCTGTQHRFTEQCRIYLDACTEGAIICVRDKRDWREHCKKYRTIPDAVASWPYGTLPPYKEYPQAPTQNQVSTQPSTTTTPNPATATNNK